MAYATIIFKNPFTGSIKAAPVGFSWTTLFFGFLPALFRGDWKWFAIMLVLAVITGGLSGLIFMFIYNSLYIKDLVGSGYQAQSISNGDLDFASSKVGIPIPRLTTA